MYYITWKYTTMLCDNIITCITLDGDTRQCYMTKLLYDNITWQYTAILHDNIIT
jgi:hypothetical protein